VPLKADGALTLKGYEVPRIWTPATRELTEDTTDGFAAIAFAEKILELKLFPWEKWLLIHGLELNEDWTYRYRTVIVEAARQNGKPISADEDVLTSCGWKKMGALVVGDEVFHPDGHITTVTDAFPWKFSSDCYRVTTTDGRNLTVDGDHLWTVQDVRRSVTRDRERSRIWETLTTRQLIDRGLRVTRRDGSATRERAFRLPVQRQIVSKPVELPIDPYLLGLWLGDGDSRDAVLSVGERDVIEITRLVAETGARIVRSWKGRTCHRVRFQISDKMRDGFISRAKRLGVWCNKHVPDQIGRAHV
jgi:hypothetical protein